VRNPRSCEQKETPIPSWEAGFIDQCLVNVSRFTAVQNRVASNLHQELEDIRRAVRGARSVACVKRRQSSRQKSQILQRHLSLSSATAGNRGLQSWRFSSNRLLRFVYSRLKPDHGPAKSLEYPEKPSRQLGVIASRLATAYRRGLTLEDLSTSYFLRDPTCV